MSNLLLEVRDLCVHHGQLCAIDGVSFDLGAGEVLAMIGANGAGKSTLLRTLVGLHHPTSGVIKFEGDDIAPLSPDRRVRLGISLVPEGRRLFSTMTLEENLLVGAFKARRGPFSIERIYELFDWMPVTTQTGGVAAVGWRAAGGRDRTGAGSQSEAACCSTNSRSAWRRSWSSGSTGWCPRSSPRG